ncbi:hypothetical protein NL676_034559 [Syzygium grande]|nr:hypothetical protein NL676_034559 [Syzygium grande]
MMAFVTATAVVASSSIAIRLFRAHKPSFRPRSGRGQPPLDLVQIWRGRAALPMAAQPHCRPSSSAATRPFRAQALPPQI